MIIKTCHNIRRSAIVRVGTQLPDHGDTVERITLGIVTIFDKLKSLKTLKPDPMNGRLFNQLFDLVTLSKTTTKQEEQILADPRIKCLVSPLRKLWGDAEYLLELDFARRVIAGGPSVHTCRQLWETFPYIHQYRQLARMETNTMDTALGEQGLPPVRKIAFLGAGPAPFTALCFRERLGPDVEMVNIDRSVEAISHGQQLARALRQEEKMDFVRAEARAHEAPTFFSSVGEGESGNGVGILALPDLRDCDMVHFAALIGETEKQKHEILIAVAKAMRPGALILLRSTEGLRQMLYPPMNVDCWEMLNVLTPVLATKNFGGATSLTTIVVSVDG